MPHISLVTLGVDDVERASQFYAALGWTRSSASEPSVTFFHGSTAALALFGRDALAADVGLPGPAPRGFAGVALAMNLPTTAAVDEMLAGAQQAGGRIVKPGQQTPWGGYAGYFADPDGHLWEVAHNPFFPLDPDGRVSLP